MPTTLAYSGCSNGHPLSVAGGGTIDDGRLRLDLCADASPLDFNPAIAALVCVDPLLAVAAGVIVVSPSEPVVFRCRADFLTEGGADLGTLVARGVMEGEGDRLAFRARLADARLAHDVGELVVAARPRARHCGVLPARRS